MTLTTAIAMGEGCASSNGCHSNGAYVWTLRGWKSVWADVPTTEDALIGLLDMSSYVEEPSQ